MATNYATWAPSSGVSQSDFLYQQIAAQKMAGLGNWSGGLDAETAMRSMATDLTKSGITSLGQIAYDPKAEKTGWQSGATPGMDDTTNPGNYIQGTPGIDENDPTWGKYGAMINKDTGQQLYSSYGERTTGNTWSGSYAGKGNTGFDINFDAEGRPIFGTHGASSADSKEAAIGFGGGLAMFAAPFIAGALGGAGAGAGAYTGPMSLGWSGAGATGELAGLAGAGQSIGGAGMAELAGGDVLGDFIASLGAQEPFVQGAGAAYSGPMSIGWNGAGATGAGGSGWLDGLGQALGVTNANGSLNTAGILKSLLSVGSGIYGMNQAKAQKALGQSAIAGSSPWTTNVQSTGTTGQDNAAMALTSAINGDLDKDAGFKLAQLNAARASSQQPGGAAASAAANAAIKYQNDRIAALSGPAGVGFSPAAGYQTSLGGTQSANTLASSSLASIGYGLTGQSNANVTMPPWLQSYLIQNGIGGARG
jgi:hypothetical protein